MEAQIKPCPFCGSFGVELGEHAHDCYLNMFANSVLDFIGVEPYEEFTDEEMREAWNTRKGEQWTRLC